MKKLLYSLMMVTIALTGCTTWDDPVTENYGDGPSINIDVTATTDSTFTFTITPGAGTAYYSYVIDDSDEAVDLDASTLLKGGYSSIYQEVLNTSNHATYTFNMRDAKGAPLGEPNTTYQIYAVAANEKGVVGAVKVVSVTTTDSQAPKPVSFTRNSANKAISVSFNQALLRGEGQVTGVYYKQFDFGNPVVLTEDDIDVAISGSTAVFTAKGVPAGAYLLFSWETGTFVDAAGNQCGAYKSTVDESGESVETIFKGLWLHVNNVSWNIEDENFTAPKAGTTFPKWDEFEGEITFKEKVYAFAEDLKAGDFVITYTNESRTVSYNLPVEHVNLGLDGDNATQKVTFTLPQATMAGDKVTVSIKEDVLFDVYGNGNDAYNSADDGIYWVAFAMTKENFIGNFEFKYISYFDEETALGGIVTIKENPNEENGIIISNLFDFGVDLYGYYNIGECKIYIYDSQELGAYGPYYCIFGNAMDDADIAITVNANGTMETEDYFGIYAFADEAYEQGLGWLDISIYGLFTKTESAPATSRAHKVNTHSWKLQEKGLKNIKKTLFRK